jgi:hypothetical protein
MSEESKNRLLPGQAKKLDRYIKNLKEAKLAPAWACREVLDLMPDCRLSDVLDAVHDRMDAVDANAFASEPIRDIIAAIVAGYVLLKCLLK